MDLILTFILNLQAQINCKHEGYCTQKMPIGSNKNKFIYTKLLFITVKEII